MSFLFLGFITGLSLILALGAQNLFVIEQGLKKNYIFLVCLICSTSDLLLIFLGIFIFNYFQEFFTLNVEIALNLLLLIFLLYFIWSKIKTEIGAIPNNKMNDSNNRISLVRRDVNAMQTHENRLINENDDASSEDQHVKPSTLSEVPSYETASRSHQINGKI